MLRVVCGRRVRGRLDRHLGGVRLAQWGFAGSWRDAWHDNGVAMTEPTPLSVAEARERVRRRMAATWRTSEKIAEDNVDLDALIAVVKAEEFKQTNE